MGRQTRMAMRRAPKPTAVLAVAGFGAFLAFLDSTVVNVAFPGIEASFPGTSLSSLSWVLNAYNIVFAGFLVAGGRFADLLGRRRSFIAGTVLFTLSSAGCAAATSVEMLVGFRVLQGIGCAVLVPASLALVIEAFPEEKVAEGITLWGATAAMAAGLGPPVGGALVDLGNWRWAFVINLPLGVIAALLAGRTVVESRAPGRRRLPDVPGTLLLAAGVSVLTLAIVKGSDWGWTSAATLGCAAAALVLLVCFAFRNGRHHAPVIDPQLLRTRRFAVGNLVTVVSGAGFYAYGLTHILWLRYVWRYSLFDAGLAVAPGALMAAVTAAVLGRIAPRIGYRVVIVFGALIWSVALFWYSTRVGVRSDFLGQWLPAQLISGVGVGATLPIVASAAMGGITGGRYATASAAISSTRQFGAVVGIAILVVILGNPSPTTAVTVFREGWRFSAICFLAAAVLALFLGGKLSSASEGADPELVADLHDPEVLSGQGIPATTIGAPHSEFYASLSGPTKALLEEEMSPLILRAGDLLFAQGDAQDGLYVVRSGQLEILIDGVLVNTQGPGDLLGELALLTGAPRSASVRARRETRLDHLSPDAFERVAKADPSVAVAVARATAERLQRLSPPPAPSRSATVIAVIGADVDAPARDVAWALTQAMSRQMRVVYPGVVDASGLQRAEAGHDRVVLSAAGAGAGDAEWLSFCLHSADRVVVVASSAEPAGFGAAALNVDGRPVDLVLIRPERRRDELLAWHSALAPRSVRHLEQSEDLDVALAPLARRLTGKSVGLVLSGGGARSLAHLGVFEELTRAGITIDRVAGTSGGAIVAALIAMGLNPSEVDAVAYEEFVRRKPMSDYTLPTRGLVRGDRAIAAVRRHTGDLLIEELPLEFHAVSVDLLARVTVDHARGSLADAVAASMRLPGLFAPLSLGDALHVDGAVLDNVPVATLTAVREGPVIAVNLGREAAVVTASPEVPSIGETLMRALLLGSDQASSVSLAGADVVITPRTSEVGFLEWHQIDVLRAAGREATRQVLPAILQAVTG